MAWLIAAFMVLAYVLVGMASASDPAPARCDYGDIACSDPYEGHYGIDGSIR